MLKFLRHYSSALCCAAAAAVVVSSTTAAPSPTELLRAETSELLEAAKLEGKERETFSKALLASTEWQHELLDSGPISDVGGSLRNLYGIWKTDPSLVTRKVDR